MPDWVCDLGDVGTDDTCNDAGGLLTVFWIDKSDIDWTAMALEANYDTDTHSILNWIILGGATFGELTFQRKNGRLDALYTRDNGYYEVSLLNLLFLGRSVGRTISLGQAINCCGIVAQVFDNTGQAMVIGKEFQNGGWVDPLDNCAINRHLGTTGGFGNRDDKSRDEVDLLCQQITPPAYSDVDLATMRTL